MSILFVRAIELYADDHYYAPNRWGQPGEHSQGRIRDHAATDPIEAARYFTQRDLSNVR